MDPKITAATRSKMIRAARHAAAAAYAPYSKFPVGAAVLTGAGRIFAGCNVENASFGLCNCAERTAVFTAAAAGARKVAAIVVYTPTAAPILPCGACRQVLSEFGPDALVISVCDTTAKIEMRLSALLPAAFGPSDLP